MADALAQYTPDRFNVLVPTQSIQQVSPWHAARTSVVMVNPDPNSGDVFDVGKRGDERIYSPAKPALMRIAAAAGIVWNWRESGPLNLTRDYVAYKAVCALRLPDGSWQPIMATKEIDLSVVEEELLESNLKKANEWAKDAKKKAWLHGATPEDYAAAQTKSNMIQWRKNKLMRAETGAMLRCIRAALGMKMQFTEAELRKPFIVPRIDFSPDYSDPEVRKALIDNGVQGMAQLYGSAAPATGDAFAASHPALVAGPESDDGPAFVGGGEDEGEVISPASQVLINGSSAAGDDADIDEALAGASHTPAPTAAQPSADGEPVADCMECHKPIKSPKVVEYSIAQYGGPLCYGCQQKRKAGGEQAS